MPGAMEGNGIAESTVTYDELELLEKDFDDAELDILRARCKRFAPLYSKREALIEKIEHFWPLVLEQAPPEIDQWIQPSDSKLFAKCLKGISVERFELDDPKGSPRSFSITFTFDKKENEYFENEELVKKFYYRQAKEGYSVLVSEPVQIDWKKGQDLTMGLNDAVWKLWQAKQKAGAKKDSDLPEYAAVVKKFESVESDAAMSFFTWFSFISSVNYITAEESAAANAKDLLNREKQRKGEKVEEEAEVDDSMDEDNIISEIHPAGEDLARLLAEDLWENALEYFAEASEQDDEDLSDLDEAMDDEDDSEGEEIDIRALVGKGKKGSKSDGSNSTSPPPKKRKT